jgi:hypothetical protein
MFDNKDILEEELVKNAFLAESLGKDLKILSLEFTKSRKLLIYGQFRSQERVLAVSK